MYIQSHHNTYMSTDSTTQLWELEQEAFNGKEWCSIRVPHLVVLVQTAHAFGSIILRKRCFRISMPLGLEGGDSMHALECWMQLVLLVHVSRVAHDAANLRITYTAVQRRRVTCVEDKKVLHL